MKKIVILTLITFSFDSVSLDLKSIVQSSLQHYPQVNQSLLQLQQAKSKTLELQGAFDAKISAIRDSRYRGFYDGRRSEIRVEKPFMSLNTRLYGGHRRSQGVYPDYEGKFETLSQGENFAGISLSLLRDRIIDNNRYKITMNQQSEAQTQLQLEQVKMNIQTLAVQAYWTWVIKGHELKVYQNILHLAEKRAKGLRQRIRAGDLAKIYAIENNQYIQKRKVRLKKSQAEFQEASFYLSLFNRNTQGNTILPTVEQLPQIPLKSVQKTKPLQPLYKRVLKKSVQLKILNSRLAQAQAQLQLGKNNFLPRLDLNYEFSQDRGEGSSSLRGAEERLWVKLEIPIEFRKAKGQKTIGKLKSMEQKIKINFTKEKLWVLLRSLKTKIDNFSDIIKITSQQIDLAQKLTQGEWIKFKKGSSDLILVNLREENLAQAQIENLEFFLKYQFYLAELKKTLMDPAL